MKKILVLVVLLGIIQNAFTQTPGRNESLVIINTIFALDRDMLEVEVNGIKELTLGNNSTGRLIVRNGNHTLTFRSLNGYLRNTPPVEQKAITISLNSQQQVIQISLGSFHGVTINTSTPVSLIGNSSPNRGIEGAIEKICETLIFELPRNSIIAVLSVSTRDRELAILTIDELEYQLVNSHEFRVVDRNTLDRIRAEQNFQMSGDVDDNSAVSIGKMLGASIVITGTISGSEPNQRLTIKALNVQTAQIVAMEREQF